MPKRIRPLEERFWAKVDRPSDPYECWEWKGAKYHSGHGQIRVNSSEDSGPGTRTGAHRVSLILHGVDPSDLHIHHLCGNSGCVNPAHLDCLTPLQHAQRHRKWTRKKVIDALYGATLEFGHTPAVYEWNPPMARKLGFFEAAERFKNRPDWPHSTTVTSLFGSWNKAILAAGLIPRKAGEWINESSRSERLSGVARNKSNDRTLI